MQRQVKSTFERNTDRIIAKAYYSKAAWIMLLVLLIFSSICSAIGKSGGHPFSFFAKHWILGLGSLMCISGLCCLALLDIRKGMRLSSEYVEQKLSSRG